VEQLPPDAGLPAADSDRLSVLAKAARRVSGTLTLDELLRNVAEEAANLLDADRATIFLHQPGPDTLVSRVAMGASQREITIRANQGVAGEAFTRGRSIRVDDAGSDPRFSPRIDQELGYHTRTLLATPMLGTEGRAIGVLEVLNKRQGRFGLQDEQMSMALASQAAVAIESSRLFECIRDDTNRLVAENERLRRQLKVPPQAEPFLGACPQVRQLLQTVEQIADVTVNVMILGETGTGKTLLARIIHDCSPRRDRHMMTLNCAALPESLLESELFGIESGVATGVTGRQGKIELADGGTLFLDEIGDMSLPMQAKILRVVQSGEFERVGGSRTLRSDVRFISATNKDLSEEMAAKRFRQDLYYRLNVVALHIPPLRQRRGDIPDLAGFLLDKANRRFAKEVAGIEPQAMACLCSAPWPGNIRQLENEIQRAVATTPSGQTISLGQLSPELAGAEPPPADGSPLTLPRAVDELQKRLIVEAMRAEGNNKTRAAARLGISREGLRKLMARLGLEASLPGDPMK
jgi:Nif-specific regulatory protein